MSDKREKLAEIETQLDGMSMRHGDYWSLSTLDGRIISGLYRENSELKEKLRWRNAKEELPPNTTPVWCRMKWHSSEKTVTFAGYYCRQYEIESTHDDECKQDYHEEKDAYFVAEGWYEEQYNWGGDWSSIAVVAGEVIEWMPVIPELVESPPTGGEG